MHQQPSKETVSVAVVESSGPSNRTILRVVLITVIVLLAVLGVLWVISKISGLILLLVLSIFFAYLVSPLVEFLRRSRRIANRTIVLPKVVAIALSYLLITAVILFAVLVVVPRLSNQYPAFAAQAKDYWQSIGQRTQRVLEYTRSSRIPQPLINAATEAQETVLSTVGGLFSASLVYVAYLPWLILIPILAFFLLKDAEGFRRSALLMLPRGRWRWRGDEFFQDVNTTLAAYIRAQLTACLFVGVVCALGFTVLGLPGGLVMGVLAGLFEFVPLVGPVAIAIMAAALATFQTGLFNAFLVLLFLGVLRIVEDYVIYPRLIGHGIHLHPLAVIFAILAGEKLAGVPGIFLAIPLVAILTVSYKHWLEHRGSEGIADLLKPTPHDLNRVAAITAENDDELDANSTPEEMARARPDLTTGELKMPEN